MQPSLSLPQAIREWTSHFLDERQAGQACADGVRSSSFHPAAGAVDTAPGTFRPRVSPIPLLQVHRQERLALRLTVLVLGLIVLSVLLLSAAGVFSVAVFRSCVIRGRHGLMSLVRRAVTGPGGRTWIFDCREKLRS